MLKYKLYQDNRDGSTTQGKWYARVAVDETIDLDGLAKHMRFHYKKYPIKNILFIFASES
jgi:hypothetical protein